MAQELESDEEVLFQVDLNGAGPRFCRPLSGQVPTVPSSLRSAPPRAMKIPEERVDERKGSKASRFSTFSTKSKLGFHSAPGCAK